MTGRNGRKLVFNLCEQYNYFLLNLCIRHINMICYQHGMFAEAAAEVHTAYVDEADRLLGEAVSCYCVYGPYLNFSLR